MKKRMLYFMCSNVIALTSSVTLAQSTPAPTVPAVSSTSPVTPYTSRPSFGAQTPFLPLSGFPNSGPFAQSKFYEQAYEIAQQYGQCAANVSPKRARAVLDASPNTRTELVELGMLTGVSRGCLPYNYRPGFIFLRGSIAEAMYKRQPAAAALHSKGTTQDQLDAFLMAEKERGGARLADDRDFANISNCLVVRAPANVRAILLSQHGSQAERHQLQSLLAAAPTCSTSSSFGKTSSVSFVRAYLAESALRWAEFS